MKKRILFLLLACFSTFGSIFGHTSGVDKDLGTLLYPFTIYETSYLLPDGNPTIQYYFTLNNPTDITITTSRSTLKHYEIYLLDAAENTISSGYVNGGQCAPVRACLPEGRYKVLIHWYDDGGRLDAEIKGEYPQVTRSARDAGTFNSYFNYADTQDTSQPYTGYPGNNAYKGGVCYRFTILENMDVTISHCGSSVNDTYLYLLDAQGNRINSNDDNRELLACANPEQAYLELPDLAAGTYYVVSLGDYYKGNITTRITGERVKDIPCIMALAVGVGTTFDSFFLYEDTQDTSIPGVGYLGHDEYRYGVCYELNLSRTMDLTISNCGSQVYNTHLYLLNRAGEKLAENSYYSGVDCCDEPSHAYLSIAKLQPGTYYVVSKGELGYQGPWYGEITTRIMGKLSEGDVGSTDKNYVMTRTYKDKYGSEWLDKIDYFDEMGRAEQTVLAGASPEGGDIVSMSEYDPYGRINKTWLSGEVKGHFGDYTSLTDLSEKVKASNDGDSSPYSFTKFESSEMARPIIQYGPGVDWQSKDKAVRTEYQLTNIAGDSILNCVRYQVADGMENTDASMTIMHTGNYSTGSLQALRKTDEDGNAVIEFSNRFGQVVLSRQLPKDDTQCHDTYTIYDEWGNLRAVLPPLAVDEMQTTEASWNTSDEVIRKYAYLYKYDARFRITAKRIPGQDWIRYVYDKANTPVFTQDGEQCKRGEWTFSITDKLGRVCLTGICKNSLSSSSMPLSTVVNAVRDNSTGVYKGYSVSGVTLVDPQVMAVNYYDDYKFMGKNGVPSSTDSDYGYDTIAGYDERHVGGSQTLLTGTLTAQLDGSETISYLPSVMYYDYRGRLIQTKTGNHLPGGVEKEYTAYDFTGNPVKHQHTHIATGKNTQTEEYTYDYDFAGRLLTSKYELDGRASINLADNEYDCIGRLQVNKRNGNANLKTSYSYNVRSWMKNSSNPLFSQKLYYNNTRDNESNTVCYNGNISAMDWTVASDGINRGYNFSYGDLSQLQRADYQENDMDSPKFNASYSYDKQGNLLTLSRNGRTASGEYGLLDDLSFNLNGNQLKAIDDSATDSAYNNGFEFRDKVHLDTEYFYDANGNLTKDLNKNITDIQYNYLNLPYLIAFADSSTIAYTYAADGKKLRTVHKIGGITTTTDYCGNVIYENGIAKMLLTEAGYISLPDKKHHFYLQDHQGNNRIVADENGNVEEMNHYYPFGGTFASASANVQPYKYNGKELDTKSGLDWYDYGARHYDAAIGRWHAADPLSEKYYGVSPYTYCVNNPVKYIDPNGEDWRVRTWYNEESRLIEYHISVNAVLYNNSSNHTIDMTKLASSITQQINDVYSISGNGFVSKMDFNMRVVNSVDDIGESDHVFRVVDQGELDQRYSGLAPGQVPADSNGFDVRISSEATEDIISGKDTRVMAHELGHTGGLPDLSKVVMDKDRLMMQAYNVLDLKGIPNESIRIPQSDIKIIRNNYIHNRFMDSSPIKKWYGKKYISR